MASRIQGIADLDLLTIGLVNDMFTERQNDDYPYKELASQEDFDRFSSKKQTTVLIWRTK